MNKEVNKLRKLQTQTNSIYGKTLYIKENLQILLDIKNILINIGKNENPQNYTINSDNLHPSIIALIEYPKKTAELINFYKGCLLCDDYFRWKLGSVAFHQHIFRYITEKLPSEEFSENNRKKLWNWSLKRCRGKEGHHYNQWSPNNSSKYDTCFTYDDKLNYDVREKQRRRAGFQKRLIQQKQAIARKTTKKKYNQLKEQRKIQNERIYNLAIKEFKLLDIDLKNILFRKLNFQFPVNLMPRDEFKRLSSNPSNNIFNSIDELNIYIKKFPKKTKPYIKIYRKNLIQLKENLNNKVEFFH